MTNDEMKKSLESNQRIEATNTIGEIVQLLALASELRIKFTPVDAETAGILGRTISWAAIGAGAAYLSTLPTPIPTSLRIGAAVAGAVIGGGLGYFTATHKIHICRVNPGEAEPIFSVTIEPC